MDYLQYDFLGEIYASDAERVGRYGFPKLKASAVLPNSPALSFNYLLSSRMPENYWFHCFCDDYQFSRLWTNFERCIPYLCRAKGLISTDFSMYRDYSQDALIWNCYRNRVMAYAMQKINDAVIPTAGFGPEYTWEWCNDGLPEHSPVAITTNGVLSDPEARRLFVGGVDALVNTKHPSALVICGSSPEWLDTKYPEIKIVHIFSYSQMWQNRRCA